MTLTPLYQINIAFERNADLLAENTSFNFQKAETTQVNINL